MRAVPAFADGDFSSARLDQLYHADLANGLGNLVSRLTALAERGGCGPWNFVHVPQPPAGYTEALERYAFDRALESLWAVVGRINREIDANRPWEWLKRGEEQELGECLERWFGDLYGVAYWLAPFLPEASRRIVEVLERHEIKAFNSLFPRQT